MAIANRAADVAIVGLGAMGAAALYQLAKRGIDVLGIDRFNPPHDCGSSHGGSRVTRLAVGEGAMYVPLVSRSHQLLDDLESEFGEKLLIRSGTLIVGSPVAATPLHGANDFLAMSMAMAKRFDIPHELFSADELKQRYPQFVTFRPTDRGYFEPQSGYIRPEACIMTQLRAASALGARVVTDTVVLRMSQSCGLVQLETSMGPIEAKRVVVAAGAWTRLLLGPPFDQLLTVTRQLLHWYEVTNHAAYAPERFPTLIWFVTDRLEDYFTAFPVADAREGLKLVATREGPDIDHETVGPRATAEESRDFYNRHAAGNLRWTVPRVIKSASCFYTSTPDHDFIVDDHPRMDRVLVVSACSGHGFKHSLGIGEAVAQRIHDGVSAIDLAPFGLDRFNRAH